MCNHIQKRKFHALVFRLFGIIFIQITFIIQLIKLSKIIKYSMMCPIQGFYEKDCR